MPFQDGAATEIELAPVTVSNARDPLLSMQAIQGKFAELARDQFGDYQSVDDKTAPESDTFGKVKKHLAEKLAEMASKKPDWQLVENAKKALVREAVILLGQYLSLNRQSIKNNEEELVIAQGFLLRAKKDPNGITKTKVQEKTENGASINKWETCSVQAIERKIRRLREKNELYRKEIFNIQKILRQTLVTDSIFVNLFHVELTPDRIAELLMTHWQEENIEENLTKKGKKRKAEADLENMTKKIADYNVLPIKEDSAEELKWRKTAVANATKVLNQLLSTADIEGEWLPDADDKEGVAAHDRAFLDALKNYRKIFSEGSDGQKKYETDTAALADKKRAYQIKMAQLIEAEIKVLAGKSVADEPQLLEKQQALAEALAIVLEEKKIPKREKIKDPVTYVETLLKIHEIVIPEYNDYVKFAGQCHSLIQTNEAFQTCKEFLPQIHQHELIDLRKIMSKTGNKDSNSASGKMEEGQVDWTETEIKFVSYHNEKLGKLRETSFQEFGMVLDGLVNHFGGRMFRAALRTGLHETLHLPITEHASKEYWKQLFNFGDEFSGQQLGELFRLLVNLSGLETIRQIKTHYFDHFNDYLENLMREQGVKEEDFEKERENYLHFAHENVLNHVMKELRLAFEKLNMEATAGMTAFQKEETLTDKKRRLHKAGVSEAQYQELLNDFKKAYNRVARRHGLDTHISKNATAPLSGLHAQTGVTNDALRTDVFFKTERTGRHDNFARRRSRQRQRARVAFAKVITFFVAFGQGAITGRGMSNLFDGLLGRVFGAMGLVAGSISNYVLFVSDAIQVIADTFTGKLFRGLSRPRKIILAGLTFGSIIPLSILMGIFAMTALAAITGGGVLFGFAAAIGILTTIVFVAAFIRSTKMILKALTKQALIDYFKRMFVDENWQYRTPSEKVAHVIKATLNGLFSILAIGLSFACVVIAMITMKSDMQAMMTSTRLFSAMTTAATGLAGMISGGIMEFIFLFRGFSGVLSRFRSKVGDALSRSLKKGTIVVHATTSARERLAQELRIKAERPKTMVLENITNKADASSAMRALQGQLSMEGTAVTKYIVFRGGSEESLQKVFAKLGKRTPDRVVAETLVLDAVTQSQLSALPKIDSNNTAQQDKMLLQYSQIHRVEFRNMTLDAVALGIERTREVNRIHTLKLANILPSVAGDTLLSMTNQWAGIVKAGGLSQIKTLHITECAEPIFSELFNMSKIDNENPKSTVKPKGLQLVEELSVKGSETMEPPTPTITKVDEQTSNIDTDSDNENPKLMRQLTTVKLGENVSSLVVNQLVHVIMDAQRDIIQEGTRRELARCETHTLHFSHLSAAGVTTAMKALNSRQDEQLLLSKQQKPRIARIRVGHMDYDAAVAFVEELKLNNSISMIDFAESYEKNDQKTKRFLEKNLEIILAKRAGDVEATRTASKPIPDLTVIWPSRKNDPYATVVPTLHALSDTLMMGFIIPLNAIGNAMVNQATGTTENIAKLLTGHTNQVVSSTVLFLGVAQSWALNKAAYITEVVRLLNIAEAKACQVLDQEKEARRLNVSSNALMGDKNILGAKMREEEQIFPTMKMERPGGVLARLSSLFGKKRPSQMEAMAAEIQSAALPNSKVGG